MKPTPILEELKIAAEAAMVAQESEAYDLMDEDVIPNIYDAIKRHEKLGALLSEIYLWCEIDARCEDSTPSQDMLNERVKVLNRAMKLVRK